MPLERIPAYAIGSHDLRMVSKEVLELIDQQKGVNMRMGSEVGKDAFMTGFCLGARLMIEVFEHERYD